jgi:hypothetical protein
LLYCIAEQVLLLYEELSITTAAKGSSHPSEKQRFQKLDQAIGETEFQDLID